MTATMIILGVFVALLGALANNARGAQQSDKIEIRMPDIRPDHADQYLCKAHRVPLVREGEYIVGVNPRGDSGHVHHMLLYGCRMPGIYQRDSPNFVWDCSAMYDKLDPQQKEESTFEKGHICADETHILYGWAMDAPALNLPQGVGFKVGDDTGINFLVLQVHYGHHEFFDTLPEVTDNAGLILETRPNSPESGITKRAGVLVLASQGYVEQGKSRHEIWCPIEEDIEIHPFKYRVHTHKMGTRVLGAKIESRRKSYRTPLKASQDLTIGIGDPQKPQMFYPVRETNMTLTRGDSVYAYCEFYNAKGHDVEIGQTGDDEMCNFYLMYWTESPNLLRKDFCQQVNPASMLSKIYDMLV